mmetsp:Transcript_3277/g.5967  ORF Transcript_3277/g.5967 Transcript_3277/m.5967 type:complete len:502 (-) Transcript_3277:143-1648(-)|eukprot:CAMPEP_0198281758 /NCGR_PEP_ID=MMETSP1449-20131203/1638_1 /TAXON_ID=420275 /ORGANISM="Attheya septentrionalis, Strain CCMP2084" /LENGTH=501 /DNA_ID=CAMNT_0043977661 /DNA_START=306 /DNA_END=1811 /DNA_ORIENTATION=+
MKSCYGHFIDGVDDVGTLEDGRATFDVENPATGETLCRVIAGTEEDVIMAVGAAKRAFESGIWSEMHPRDRARILNKAAELLRERTNDIAMIESLSTGRSLKEMKAQLGRVPEWLEHAGALAVGLEGSVTPFVGPFLSYVRRKPLGVVAQITPWNHPLLIATKKVAPALAAGNCVVMKPSEIAPIAVMELAQILTEAGVPPGVINVVNGMGPATGKALCESPDVSKIDLTGGTQTGRAVCAAAGHNLKPVTAELGGKAPVLVFEDADIERAINGIAFGAFVASGQTCISAARLIVAESIMDQVVSGLVHKAKGIVVGDPLDPHTQMGSIACKRQLDHIEALVDSARDEGASILCGGGRPEGLDQSLSAGHFYAPTILGNVTPNMRVFQEEIFGPVLTVTCFRTEEEALSLANDCQFGLGAAVWTSSVARAHRVAHKIEAGIVWINDHHKNDPASPWGGFKDSGMGKENGWESLHAYTKTQSIMVNLSDTGSDWFGGGTRYS